MSVILRSPERYGNGLRAIRTHSFLSLGFCVIEADLKLQIVFSIGFLIYHFLCFGRGSHTPCRYR